MEIIYGVLYKADEMYSEISNQKFIYAYASIRQQEILDIFSNINQCFQLDKDFIIKKSYIAKESRMVVRKMVSTCLSLMENYFEMIKACFERCQRGNRKMVEKMKKACLLSLFILCVAAITYYIFGFSKGLVNSDTASIVLFANQQLEQHRIFPKGYCYSTGVFFLGMELLVSLLMRVIKDWVLCREIAQFVQVILLIVLFWLFFIPEKSEKKFCGKYLGGMLCTILVSFPICTDIFGELYYEAAYAKNVILLLIIFISIKKFLVIEKRNKKYLCLFTLALASVISNFGIRNIMIVEVPLILAVLCSSVDIKHKKLDLSFNEKAIMGISGIGTAMGFIVFRFITRYVGKGSQTDMFQFVAPDVLVQNIGDFVIHMLRTYGVGEETTLLSLKGISISFNVLYMIFSVLIVPVFWLLHYQKIENKFWKVFVIYSWISNLFLSYLLIVTSIAPGGGRYLYTLYINNLILFTGFSIYFMKKNEIFNRYFVFYMTFYAFLVHVSYIQVTNIEVDKKSQKDEELISYLTSNNLDFGYATFWNAYKYTMLTSGNLEVVAYVNEPIKPYYWLTSKSWYYPSAHPGRMFLLVNNNGGVRINEEYYKKAEKVTRIGDYTILIYSKNILLYPELVYDILQENIAREIELENLSVAENAYFYKNQKIVLKKDGLQYGPYWNLDSGEYQVCVRGKNLDCAKFQIKKGIIYNGEDVNIEKQTDEEVIYSFSLDSFYPSVELLTSNQETDSVEIDSITIKCIKRFASEYYPYQLFCTGEAYYDDGNIILEEGGEEYGPYDDLEAGEYYVKITGENIDLAEVFVTSNASNQIPVKDMVANGNVLEFTFKLEKPAEQVEYHIRNMQEKSISISRLNVRKEK